MLRNPLLDWLDLYGEDHGFVRDSDLPGYDERLQYPPFLMRKGQEFEQAIARYLGRLAPMITIAERPQDVRDPAAAAQTLEALSNGQAIVHQAVLRDEASETYGAADLIVRSDTFAELFPDHLSPGEASLPGPRLSDEWHYVVVDIKFTTLDLLVSGLVRSTGGARAYKAQLYVYNRALGNLQGYTPPRAFLLGRGFEQRVKKVTQRSANAMERLAPVEMTEDIATELATACQWFRRLRKEGAGWSPLPEPTVPELWPNAGEDSYPWAEATKRISTELNELTQLWYVGPDRRDQAQSQGVTSWKDPKATSVLLGVTGTSTGPTLQAIIDMNREDAGPPIIPASVHSAEDEWRPVPGVEFFVDFEYVNNVDDDFSEIPDQNGQNLIFMIGCGHMEDAKWVFRCFTVDQLTEQCEAQIIDEWLAHMTSIHQALGGDEPRLIHWSQAEPVNYEESYDSACKRHPEKRWPSLNWFDLLVRVVRKEPVVVRGSLNFGLKSFARALHSQGLIETSWGESKVDGLGAMTGAWWCHKEARESDRRLIDTTLMQEIARYNEVDCKVMMEIMNLLRRQH